MSLQQAEVPLLEAGRGNIRGELHQHQIQQYEIIWVVIVGFCLKQFPHPDDGYIC